VGEVVSPAVRTFVGVVGGICVAAAVFGAMGFFEVLGVLRFFRAA
jgi:hypothetical protein